MGMPACTRPDELGLAAVHRYAYYPLALGDDPDVLAIDAPDLMT
jgi:hypothetical protein